MATQGGNEGRERNNNCGINQQVRVEELRKGPWTPEEDAILKNYVTKNGEGNWNVLQKLSGLNRCNKSCRLRWVNHLRPNLKKGAITAEEEAVIVQLHQKTGNKWAYIAAQLPGRTDNEIKNFWHTRRKKRQRANLPLYPTQSDKEEINNHIHSVPIIPTNPSPSSLQSPCMTTFFQPPIYEKFGSMSYSPNNNVDQIDTIYRQNNNNINNNYVNQNYSFFPLNNFNDATGFTGQLNSSSTFNLDSNPNPHLVGSQTNEQNSHQVVNTTPLEVDIFNHHSYGNDGLLEDIVNHTKTLNEKSGKNIEVNESPDQKFISDYKIDNERPIGLEDRSLYGGQNFIQANYIQESSSSRLVVGSMETNTVNYGFFNSLDNYPVTGGPMPEWYDGAGPVATAQLLTSFNGVQQTTMPNLQELFNSSNSMPMETSTMAFNGVQTTMPNRQELINPLNSMAMAIPQPFMYNSGNVDGDTNISEIDQWWKF